MRSSKRDLETYRKAVERLRSQPDFVVVVEALQDRREALRDKLMIASGDDLLWTQGRTQEITDLLKDLTTEKR